MSSSPLPSKIRPSQNQFISDLAQVFRRHRIRSGHSGDICHLGSTLELSTSFRGDLFTLCNAISHMSEMDLSAEAMLDLVARAITGAHESDPPVEIPPQVAASFVSHYNEWNEQNGGMLPGLADEDDDSSSGWSTPPTPFTTAASLSSGSPEEFREFDRTPDPPPPSPPGAVTPESPIGTLTLGELKYYLDDIEQRVTRLQPYLDAVTRSAAASKTAAAQPAQIPAPEPSRRTPQNPADAEYKSRTRPAAVANSAAREPAAEPGEWSLRELRARAAETASAAAASLRKSAQRARPISGAEFGDEPRPLIPEDVSRRRSLMLVGGAAAVAVIITASAIGYRAFSKPADPTPAAATSPDLPELEPAPTSQAGSLASAPTSDQQLHPANSTATISVPSPKTPVPTASVSSNSSWADTIKQWLNPAPPPPATPPLMSAAVPTLPPAGQTTSVVRAPSRTQPMKVIEPFNQRTVAEPPPKNPAQSNVAAAAPIVRPDMPKAADASANRKPIDGEQTVSVPSPVMMAYAVSTPPPTYPTLHHSSVESSVLVQATIGKNGNVINAKAVNGSPDLAAAAIAATEKWRFRPYMLNDTPVEVVTTIRFLFKAH